MKVDFDMSDGLVTVKADALEIDLDVKVVSTITANAVAETVKDAIRSQPGDKWNKTGRLLAGIDASGGDVSAPYDRLGRPDLAERFAVEVMPRDVTANPRVMAALRKAVDGMIK